MSDGKKDPESVSFTVSAEHSQKGKRGKKKISKNFRQNIVKNIPVQDVMQPTGSVSSPKPNPQRESNIDLNEFPQLVRKDHKVRTSQFQKSWKPFVNCRENGNDLDGMFPKVSHFQNSQKKKDNVLSKKNEPETTSGKQEDSGKTDVSSTPVKEGRVKPGNNYEKHMQPKEKTQTQRNPVKKKRADPVLINLNEILEVNKTHRKTNKHKTFKCKSRRLDNKEKLSGNILDSSNPKRNKGKHREVKKKRLTNLKLIILKEKIIKRKLKEIQVDGSPGNSYIDVIENINFKEEIVKYLKELEEKKIKMKEGGKNKGQQNVQTDVKIKKVKGKLSENKDEHPKVECLKEMNNCSLEKSNVESVLKTKKEKGTLISCRVREYCENVVTPALNSAVTELIKEVVSLQDKLFARDPVKAKAKRRHVSGFREVKKFLNLKKVKMIVIPPNLEKLQMKGSVFDVINEMKEMANIQNVPYVFALDRYKLGRCTRKNVPVGAFAILNYEGLEDRFKNVLVHLHEAKQHFADVMSETTAKFKGENIGQEISDTVVKTIIKDEQETKEENSDEEDVSQKIFSFLTSLRELSLKK